MAHVAIVGGGPAGLTAGLFTAKNGLDTTLFDTDETWLHDAHLFNFPGIGSVGGEEFLSRLRFQAESFGVHRKHGVYVSNVFKDGSEFHVVTDGIGCAADYVVLATGVNRSLAASLGCEFTDEGLVAVDLGMETSVSGAYATGGMVRDGTWQAVISAGDGAAAALDILSTERGERIHDFDTPRTDAVRRATRVARRYRPRGPGL